MIERQKKQKSIEQQNGMKIEGGKNIGKIEAIEQDMTIEQQKIEESIVMEIQKIELFKIKDRIQNDRKTDDSTLNDRKTDDSTLNDRKTDDRTLEREIEV